MSTPKETKKFRLNLRLDEQEWNKIHKHCSKTTCRSVSEYSRKVLLNQPVRILVRNQSFDDFEEQLAPLLPILKTFGDDLHALVERLSHSNKPEAIQACLGIITHHAENFLRTSTQIKDLLIQISDTCAQK
jgi:hypothetical protein